MTLKVTIFGVVHAHHVRWGVPKGLMENVVVDLGFLLIMTYGSDVW